MKLLSRFLLPALSLLFLPGAAGNFVQVVDYPDLRLVPTGFQTQLTGITNTGLAVGYYCCRYFLGSTTTIGFVVDGTNLSTGFGWLDPATGQYAAKPIGIDAAGDIIGESYNEADFTYRGLLQPSILSLIFPGDLNNAGTYDGLQTIAYPGLIPSFGDTFFTGINDSGEIVGYYRDYTNGADAGFVFKNGVFTPLDYRPYAINNNGQILGTSPDLDGTYFIDTNGVRKVLPGKFPNNVKGLNDAGEVVGGDYTYYNGTFTQFQIPGATSVSVNGINDRGQIVGSFDDALGEHGFISTTPEPGYAAVLLLGLGGLAAARGRILAKRTRRA